MTTELFYLAAASALTGLLWVPYVLNRLLVGPGLLHEVGYPAEATVLSPWAARLKKAHENAIQNLPVFGVLVLASHVAGISNEATVWAAIIYFWARVAHAVAYASGIPWVRTLSFSVGFGSQALFAYLLLTH